MTPGSSSRNRLRKQVGTILDHSSTDENLVEREIRAVIMAWNIPTDDLRVMVTRNRGKPVACITGACFGRATPLIVGDVPHGVS